VERCGGRRPERGACSSSAALAPPRRAWNLGLGAVERCGGRRPERGAVGDGEGGRSEVQWAMGRKAAGVERALAAEQWIEHESETKSSGRSGDEAEWPGEIFG
jgi:hypothetical protein